MRNTLYWKFVIVYITFAALSLLTVYTLSSELFIRQLEQETADTLYEEAISFSSAYLPGYFSGNLSLSDIRMQLDWASSYMDASFWFTDTDGLMITSIRTPGEVPPPSSITNFNPAEGDGKQYFIGNYHGAFLDDVITVIAPVTQGFVIKGYLLIHKPYNDLIQYRTNLLSITYLTVIVVYLLSFCILLGFRFFVYRPLSRISEAAKQYALGNLAYEIPVHSSDEMGYLSASLNYMSSQLKDMDISQKKFVANISHDFRSPLTSIKGYIEAMVDGTIPIESFDKYLNIILFETERLTDLTRDLLTLNTFDSKAAFLNKSVFDIHDVIKNTAASFEGQCFEKEISIELLLAGKVKNVYADSSKIKQVLYNLLDNALKFSHEDSSIIIETTDRSGKISISIKDTGIGIPREHLIKIWERFYKSDSSRGKDKKGTGLGLSIVKEIIQAHGEHIDVFSTVGVGTEFSFTLPKREPPAT